jgi:hypothetical protein
MPGKLRKITSEEAREMQRIGAQKLKERNASRKQMKFTIDTLLSKSLKKGELCTADDVMSLAEMDGKNIDVQTAIMIAVVQRALMGDMTAVQFLRDTVGEKPSDKIELDSSLTVETWAKKHKVKL